MKEPLTESLFYDKFQLYAGSGIGSVKYLNRSQQFIQIPQTNFQDSRMS